MSVKTKQEPQQPLILRAHRLMEAFAKSDDERDFYLDRLEGFIIFVDLDKPPSDVEDLEKDLAKNQDRFCMIPKLTFYETKKIMEGFVNEKVYDIDTKEKLLDIIQSKEARTTFLEFIYDHLTELEKWQQYYQERSRIRIIEWLRQNHFNFVFEEDLEFSRSLLEKVKQSLFQNKPSKEVLAARKGLITKAKTYYSNEALNPRPKRGRPPKQAAKQEIEPQFSTDIYMTATPLVRPFLFIPDISSATLTFSSSFENPEMQASRRGQQSYLDANLDNFQQKLAALRTLSKKWTDEEEESEDDSELDLEDEIDLEVAKSRAKPAGKPKLNGKAQKTPAKPIQKAAQKPKSKAKQKTAPPRKMPLRPIIKANNKNISTTPSGKRKHKRIIPIHKAESKTKPLRKIAPRKAIAKPKPKATPKANAVHKMKGKPLAKSKPLVKAKPKPLAKIAPKNNKSKKAAPSSRRR